MSQPLLRVEHLVVEFSSPGGDVVHAVSDVSFELERGETLGIVGESGCGKSSTGRAILSLPQPTRGSVWLDDTNLAGLSGSRLRQARTQVQMVFQDPISSLHPHRRVADLIGEPLKIWHRGGDRRERRNLVAEAMEAVGLDYGSHGRRYPHQFSGGQCQRVSIARALVLAPQLLVCDEAVASLDVSVQAQILNLLEDVKVDRQLSMIFISHDLSVVRHISDRIAVMYLGKLCEIGPAEAVYAAARHHYTAALVGSAPSHNAVRLREGATVLTGEPPSPVDPPSGCRFRTRCPRADSLCAEREPPMTIVGPDHAVACHHPVEPVTGS